MAPRPTARHRRARADALVPAVVCAGLFLQLYAVALVRTRALEGSYDLGYFRQAAWLITEWRRPFVTVRGLHLLGDHFSPTFLPMAVLTWPLPDIPALLLVQSAALAVGALPLWLLCRREAGLGPWAAGGVLVAYALFPALHNVNLSDFHPEVAAVPALLGALLFGREGRWWPYGACVAVVLGGREDHALVVAGLGALLVLDGRRRAGGATVVVALAWLVVVTSVIMPSLADGFVPASFLEQYGSDLGEILRTMAGDPGRVLGDLWTAQNRDLLWSLLAPVAFLPLLAPRWLVPVLPLQLLHLLSTRELAHTIDAHYSVVAIAVVLAAAAMGLGRLQRWVPAAVRVAPPLLLLVGWYSHYHLAADSWREAPWRWYRDDTDLARLEAADVVPEDAAVAASVRLWPLLADRAALFNFPAPWEGYDAAEDPVPLAERRRETEWVAVDTADAVQWSGDRAEALDELVDELDLRLVYDRLGIQVYRRD